MKPTIDDLLERLVREQTTDTVGAKTFQKILVVSAKEFGANQEELATSLLGSPDECLLPANGTMLVYGDGGAGKTTLVLDLATHLAKGTPWVGGVEVPQPLNVLVIEAEGPRAQFRRKIHAKLEYEQCETGITILVEPWAAYSFGDIDLLEQLAQHVRENNVDVIVVGPLAAVGATGGGTPEEVESFSRLISLFRDRAERDVALIVVHHENKQGDVAGAWERWPDSLVHVTAQGNGRTRLVWRKTRWSSKHHGVAWNLSWAEGASFRLDDEPGERDYVSMILSRLEEASGWATLDEIRENIGPKDVVRKILSNLVEGSKVEYQVGPSGRHPTSRCWRLVRTGTALFP